MYRCNNLIEVTCEICGGKAVTRNDANAWLPQIHTNPYTCERYLEAARKK